MEALSGRVQRGESPLAAAAREIDEECGLRVTLDPRPVDAHAATRAGEPMVVIVYRAIHDGGEVRMSEEHDAFEWLSPEELAARSPFTALVQAVYRAASIES